MEIKIKKLGVTQGTVGWLAAGLENGSIRIIESTIKGNGNHGLWLKVYSDGIDNASHESMSQFLAAFNQFGLKPGEYRNACMYELCDDFVDRDYLWTDAAWQTLMSLATNWCDLRNELISNEPPKEYGIKRVEVTG